MRKTIYVSLLTLILSVTLIIITIQPWSDISVDSTYSTSSTNDISTYITITANEFFITDTEDLTEHLLALYEANALPNIMLSDDHYTKNSSITFLVHTNRITRLLGFDYLEIEI